MAQYGSATSRRRFRPTEHRSAPLAWIIILNATPLLGVLGLGWGVFELVLLYCLENGVVWFFTLLRILARPYQDSVGVRTAVAHAAAFAAHFGVFAGAYGLVVFGTFSELGPRSEPLPGLSLGVLSLVALHAIEWRGDVKERGFGADGAFWLMVWPYKRIIVMHVCILGFGALFQALGDPGIACALVIAVKAAFDVYRQLQPAAPTRVDPFRMTELKDLILKRHLGAETRFQSFAEMAKSPTFQAWLSEKRVALNPEEFTELEDYLIDKLVRERDLAQRDAEVMA